MKKFITYFCLIFIITFGLLNARFVSAEIRFWFSPLMANSDDTPFQGDSSFLARMHDKDQVTHTLPLSDSNDFFLEIPAIGAKAPIIIERSADQNIIFKDLEEGVVHYADSPLPGQKGTAIILGHSSAYPWYKGHYGSVFALLSNLKVGDFIYINNGGKILSYKVKESVIFHPFTKDQSIDQMVQTDTSSIILVSCWPVGTNSKRIAIKADLVGR